MTEVTYNFQGEGLFSLTPAPSANLFIRINCMWMLFLRADALRHLPVHIVPGGTDKSYAGDYENCFRYVKFGGLAILKP